MNELAALEAACVADGTDNTRRLALADWLEEHGRTDRDAARVEWIRLTCAKHRKSVMFRQLGERDWVYANAHRLWPNLMARVHYPRHPRPHVSLVLSLGIGSFSFRIGIPGQNSRKTTSIVTLWGRRGVINNASVTFLRAAFVAPLVAADEPLSVIRFDGGGVDQVAYYRSSGPREGGYLVSEHRMNIRGLGGVFGLMEGWQDEGELNDGGRCRSYTRQMFGDPVRTKMAVYMALTTALTRWARDRAGQPHTPLYGAPLIDVLAETKPDGPELIAPPRILPATQFRSSNG